MALVHRTTGACQSDDRPQNESSPLRTAGCSTRDRASSGRPPRSSRTAAGCGGGPRPRPPPAEPVTGGAPHPQAHAAEAAARQIEAVHAIHRSGDARPPIERRERVLLRYEQVLDLDVVAARAPHAADVPGVDDLDLR